MSGEHSLCIPPLLPTDALLLMRITANTSGNSYITSYSLALIQSTFNLTAMLPLIIGVAMQFHLLVDVIAASNQLFETLVPAVIGRLINNEMEGILFSPTLFSYTSFSSTSDHASTNNVHWKSSY
jgi:uncharacterized membrane protein YGL010W